MNYQKLINGFCGNDATIQAVTVAVVAVNFAKATVQAGKNTRLWWETDEAVAPLIRLVGQVIWLAAVLAWSARSSGKAQAHWVFVNAVVDDGLGIYGTSPMGDALAAWVGKKARIAWGLTAWTCVWVVNRLGAAVARRYGMAQARVFAAR